MKSKSPFEDADVDQQAIESLARSHRPALLRYFQRKGFRPPDDEDAAQEVLYRIVRKSSGSHEIEQFDRYMFTTAANVAIDLRRAALVRKEWNNEPYDDDLHAVPDYDPEQILAGRQTLDIVLITLRKLPERQRTIFILIRIEKIKQAEIARRLGVSLTTVEKEFRAALNYLGKSVGRQK